VPTQIISNPHTVLDPCGTCAGLIHHLKPKQNTTHLKTNPLSKHSHLRSSGRITCGNLSRHIPLGLGVILDRPSSGGPSHKNFRSRAITGNLDTPVAITTSVILISFGLVKNKQLDNDTRQSTLNSNVAELTRFSSSIFCIQYSRSCLVHQFFTSLRYPTSFHKKILKDRSIARKSQLFELQKMLASFPCKHLEDSNEGIANNILVTFCKGGWKHCNLFIEPMQKIRQRSIDRELRTPSTEASVQRRSSTIFL
jgi:hypothetical protein